MCGMRLGLSCAMWFVLAMASLGCASSPGVSLADARRGNAATHLVEGPVLARRADGYVLRYRFAPSPPDAAPAFAMSVAARRDAGAGYYFFVGVVQSTVLERGRVVERRLANDGLEELARAGRVRWLDPDGATHAIPIVGEAAP